MLENDELVEVNLDSSGNVLPPKNDKIALIDADTICFAACSVCQQVEELLPREMYIDSEWDTIVNGDNDENHITEYIEEAQVVRSIYLDEVLVHVLDKVGEILNRTGCNSFELHFTRGRKSFPYKVDPNYKANRSISGDLSNSEDLDRYLKTPIGLNEIKDYLVKKFPGKVYNNYKCEADHIVVCKKRDFKDNYILCAVDKDVLYALPGKHFNYYSSARHNIDMKWVEVSEGDAMKRYYIQTLTGDKGDNIIGIKGIGPKKAEKALADCATPKECWEVVVAMYEKAGRTEIDAIINMRLVSMHQLKLVNKDKPFTNISEDDYEVVLWKPSLTDNFIEEGYKCK